MFIHRCAIIVVNTMGADEEMPYAPLLLFGRGGGTNRDFAENLTGVGINDRYMKILSHTEAEFSLAYARRAEYHN